MVADTPERASVDALAARLAPRLTEGALPGELTGFGTQDYGQVLAGGILVAGLCLVSEGLLAIAQHALTPRGLRALARDTSDTPTRRTKRAQITSPALAEAPASGSNRSGSSA